MPGTRRLTALLVAIGTAVGMQVIGAPPSTAVSETCSTMAFPPAPATQVATVTLCLQSTGLGATVSGSVEVGASITIDPPGAVAVDRMTFWRGSIAVGAPAPAYLL